MVMDLSPAVLFSATGCSDPLKTWETQVSTIFSQNPPVDKVYDENLRCFCYQLDDGTSLGSPKSVAPKNRYLREPTLGLKHGYLTALIKHVRQYVKN